MGDSMGNWIKNIKKVEAYVPGEQPRFEKMIKLNTNENPYPPSKKVLEALAILSKNGEDDLRKYPDPNCSKLVQTISAYHGVWSENVFVGVGSDDVLSVAFQTFFNGILPIIMPDITYSFYKVWANLYKIAYKQAPLLDDFKIKLSDYFIPNGGIVIPNPNAPTGILLDLVDIEAIVAKNQNSVVIIDEAYIDFGGKSAISLIDKYENLLVVRTFSKSRSLAGLRVGYAIGSKTLISALENVKFAINSYTLNAPALVSAIASIKDDAYFKEVINKVKETREYTVKNLIDSNFKVLESSANFVFAKHIRLKGVEIYNELKAAKIFVRHFNDEKIKDYIRITIGTKEEMDAFFKELKKIIVELGSRF